MIENPKDTSKENSNDDFNDVTEKIDENQIDDEDSDSQQTLQEEVIEVLKTVFDPEIPVNIYELGLIYKITIPEEKKVHVDMTLTSPACPVAGSLPGEIENKIRALKNVDNVKVELVWDPPWDQSKMSEAAKLELGLF